jgi:formylglycine-generating enzyme
VGGSVKRRLTAAAASILVLGTSLLAGSCANPLNWALQVWGQVDLVKVAGGTSFLGNDGGGDADETPSHQVGLSGFSISRFEITQYVFYAVMGYNNSYSASRSDSSLPVENVSWTEAIQFCNDLSDLAGLQRCYTIDYDGMTVTWDTGADGYRLPTEAEWEYAASGGQYDTNLTYAGSNYPDEVGWFWDNTVSDGFNDETVSVGSLSSNELGLYDMSGNVWEWCWDGYDPTYYSWMESVNPLGPNGNFAFMGASYVQRGGSVNMIAYELRVERRWANSDGEYLDVGFRVARNN